MNKGLKILIIPTAVLMLTVGFLLPVFNTLQEERCNLAFTGLIESDLMNVQSLKQIIAEHPDTAAYLMKHPKQTLRICLAYEAENADNDKLNLVMDLGALAYEKIDSQKLPPEPKTLKEKLLHGNPGLYDELTAY